MSVLSETMYYLIVFNMRTMYIFQELLREAGCLVKLVSLLRSHSMALRVGFSTMYPAIVSRVTTTINNLALNEENQKQLKVIMN